MTRLSGGTKSPLLDCLAVQSRNNQQKRHGSACVLQRIKFSRLSSSCMSPAATRGKNTENKVWKRVVSSETEFAWLPPDIAWAFCSDALRRRSDCQYLAFDEAHMGLHGHAFQATIFIGDMVFLGETRSAEELAVFTTWPQKGCA